MIPTDAPIPQIDDLLTTYQQTMRQCTRCVETGFLTEAHPVFRGHAGQRQMIVGQAPGARGHADGIPWSGPVGVLLSGWLQQAGFPRETFLDDWYLTSLTKCFPGKAPSGKGDRAPSMKEIRLCADHLATEIALVRPQLIVALGRLAIVRLLPEMRGASLAELVGTLHHADLGYGEIPIISLPHPSGVSRWRNDPANRARTDRALALLSRERERLHLGGSSSPDHESEAD